MNNTIRATGEIILKLRKGDDIIRKDMYKNLVVAAGKNIIAQLLGGGLSTTITTAKAGTNGTAAADTDTDVTDGIAVTISNVSYPASNQVLFEFTFPADLVGDVQVQEVGLFAANGSLFARKATPVYNVPAGTNLDGSWLITINN